MFLFLFFLQSLSFLLPRHQCVRVKSFSFVVETLPKHQCARGQRSPVRPTKGRAKYIPDFQEAAAFCFLYKKQNRKGLTFTRSRYVPPGMCRLVRRRRQRSNDVTSGCVSTCLYCTCLSLSLSLVLSLSPTSYIFSLLVCKTYAW